LKEWISRGDKRAEKNKEDSEKILSFLALAHQKSPDLVKSFILPSRWNKNELTERSSILKQKAPQLCAIFRNFEQQLHNSMGLR
jgi:hypothetical protein